MTVFGLLLFIALLSSCPAIADGPYAAIDSHARAAPSSAATSVKALAGYLSESAQTDRDKARAIFTWIGHNIAYDMSRFGAAPDAEEVLETRRAVCAGYAVLFKALADAAGLEAVVINGDAKGVGPPAAIDADGLLNHDWNAVRIDGQWHLLDGTWGAGRIDEYGRFIRDFCDHYFFTSPEVFVYDHLPGDDRWQLLPTALSREAFIAQARVQPAFFRHRLRLLSHRLGRMEAQGGLTVKVGAADDTIVVASLHQNGAMLEEGYTFAQREPDGFSIHLLLPREGDYLLRLYARARNSVQAEYDSAIEYKIHNTRPGSGRFPKMYGSFQERECYLAEPFAGALAVGPTKFSICVPGAEDVVVGVNGLPQKLTRDGDDAFSGIALVEEGRATVFARFPGHRKYEGLLQYVVR
jgi:hypothetical protein